MSDDKDYLPPSSFLQMMIGEEVPVSGSSYGDANLTQLIAMLKDQDRANRDWAALLLSQTPLDTPKVRQALLGALSDDDEDVRAEALVGLAMRDGTSAFEYVEAQLRGSVIGQLTLEAAEYVADARLLPLLVEIKQDGTGADDSHFIHLIDNAIASCKSGNPPPTSFD